MTQEIQKRESAPDVWSDLDHAFAELSSRFFEPFGLASYGTAVRSDGALFRPARTDVRDTGASYTIVAEVPGIPKDKLDVRVRGTTVEIRGEAESETEEKARSFVHRERSYQGYYRTLDLPEPVVATDAKAKVDNGLLELELPKLQPTPSPDEVKIPVA